MFVIRDARDSALLQLEIDKFLGWASANGLTVNNNKCNFISLTSVTKRANGIHARSRFAGEG